MTTTSESAAPASQRPRLQQRYRDEIVPALQEQFHYTNIMTVPGLTKVVVVIRSPLRTCERSGCCASRGTSTRRDGSSLRRHGGSRSGS